MVKHLTWFLCLAVILLLTGTTAIAQNTKGDRPVPSEREARFKTQRNTRPAQRVRRSERADKKVSSRPSRQRARGERPGRPIRPMFSKSRPSESQKPWKGDIAGRRIRPRASSARASNVYPQPPNTNYSSEDPSRHRRANENPAVRRVRKMQAKSDKPRVGKPIRPVFHKSRPQHREKPWRGDLTGRRIRTGRSDRGDNPLLPNFSRAPGGAVAQDRRQTGIIPRIFGRARNTVAGGGSVGTYPRRPQRYQNPANKTALAMLRRHRGPDGYSPGRRIKPRSASSPYISRRSINVWAQFSRQRRRQETATLKDLAGKKLRGRNYETQRPELINPTMRFQKRIPGGDRPGPPGGGYLSKTRQGQRAWKGDIAHYRVRGGRPPGRGERHARMLKGGGFQSATVHGEGRPGSRLQGRTPGAGARGIGNWRGNIRVGQKGFSDQGEEYSGSIKLRRQLKGGGSVSGRTWNNRGNPIAGRTPGKDAARIGYSGNMKARPRLYKDQGEEYTGNINVNTRRGFTDQGEEFTGNIKARRPDKGGGSRSGKLWNNNNTPIAVRVPSSKSARIGRYQGNMRARDREYQDQGEEYTGNIKARRPDKGGGSVSGVLWNNKGRPIEGKIYASQSTKYTRYAGNIKARRPDKGGGSVSGKLWNNDEKPIEVRQPKSTEADRFVGNVRIKRSGYRRNPNSDDEALPVKEASSASMRAGTSARGIKRNWDYVKNPSSADDAQKTREHGRAFTRGTGFQGNIKTKRFELFADRNLHPDASFIKLNRNNVPEEKDMFTNLKLWWARLFRKSETQPDHLKEKERKPRYDKGEAGLWYD